MIRAYCYTYNQLVTYVPNAESDHGLYACRCSVVCGCGCGAGSGSGLGSCACSALDSGVDSNSHSTFDPSSVSALSTALGLGFGCS